jgi:hypothetical protein
MTINSRVADVFLALSALLVVLAIACSSSGPTGPGSTSTSSATSGSTNPGPNGGSTGTLTVMLKDSPFSEASAVLVTFNGVSVHMSGGDWKPLTLEGDQPLVRTCDLKKLEGPQEVLGTAVLAAGHYTQIRLMVASATIYQGGTKALGTLACAATETPLLPSGSEVVSSPVVVPSGEIKLNREFDLGASGATMIVLDFDGEKSISQTGNGKYMMKPVISVVSVTNVVE